MPKTPSEHLKQVKNLFNDGKFEEALQLLNNLEQDEVFALEERLKTLHYKSWVSFYLGQLETSFQIADYLYQKSQETEMPLFTLDAISRKEAIFFLQARFEEFYRSFEHYETLFKSIPPEDSLKYKEREVFYYIIKALAIYPKGKLDLTLDYNIKSLKLFEQIDPNSLYISFIYAHMAYAYMEKGELNLALECNEKALKLIPEGEYFYLGVMKGAIYRSMGHVFNQKGDLNRALEYHLMDLVISKKINFEQTYASLYAIISILVAKKDFKQAQKYLQQ